MQKSWKDVNGIYQIYPRSFMDSNGDGVGDLRGVIERLDYLKGQKDSLGIDAIWFSPIFSSPMADFGYDVSNYCDIHPLFGNIDDFKELVEKAHTQGIKVMVDYVPNHTSDQHPWFQQSQQSKTGDKSDFYVWRDAKPDGSPPNNWLSIFGGSAWEWSDARQQYYLHTFLKEQPDLNWANPSVRAEMREVLRFWFDLGVDGIRADAVRFMAKDSKFRDDPVNPNYVEKLGSDPYWGLIHSNSRFGEKLFEYLRELTDVVAEYDDRIMIFEDYPDSEIGDVREQYLGFYSVNPAVSMPFNFDGIGAPFDAEVYSRFVSEFQGMLTDEHTPVYCFGNHDQPRLVSRVGAEQARVVALLQLTLPGLPVIYYGDEIGMEDVDIPEDRVQDPIVVTQPGLGYGRDPERTPMRWSDTKNAGFSEADEPWLPVGDKVAIINVETQLGDPDSFLALYRRLLRLRNRHDVLRYGDYETFGEPADGTMTFARRYENEHVFVAANFTGEEVRVDLPHTGRILCCTHPVDYPDISPDGIVKLRPYEAVLVECVEHPVDED